MKKNYCKHCGLELERGSCSCEKSKNEVKEAKKQIRCTTCGEKIDFDSVFCPYCGIPTYGEINKENLEKELQGDFAEDVIDHYEIKGKIKENGTVVQKKKIGIIGKITILLAVILVVLLIGLFIKRYKITNLIEKGVEETDENEIATGIEPTAKGQEKKEEETEEESVEKDKEEIYEEEDEETGEEKETEKINDEKNKETGKKENNEIKKEEEKQTEKETEEKTETTTETTTETATIETTKKSKEIQTLDNGGTIKSSGTKKDIYISDLKKVDDEIKNGTNTCELVYYCPIFDGKDTEEVEEINAALEDVYYGDLGNKMKAIIEEMQEFPKSIILDTVELGNANDKRLIINISGKITPKEGLTNKCKFRIVYNRITGQLDVKNTTE